MQLLLKQKSFTLSPVLQVTVFSRKIHSFHFFGILGYLLGTGLGMYLCYVLSLRISIILLMALIGALTFYALAFFAKKITGRETIVYYHHEIAILLICSIVLFVTGMPVLRYLDITLIGIATFLGFGRIGCFSVGCCHGKPSHRGITYNHSHVEDGFPYYFEKVVLFPIQLVESIFVFLVVISGSIMLIRGVAPGTVLIYYTAVYGTFRFIIEFFRGDSERPYFSGLSEAQWTTLLLLAVSLLLSRFNVVPFYYWHLVLSVFAFAIAVVTIFRSKVSQDVLSPHHVMQIASGLFELSQPKTLLPGSVMMFQTDLGFVFSKGEIVDDKSLATHYTISSISKNKLNFKLVKKMGDLIKNLQHHQGSFLVNEKQNGIFHILFYKKSGTINIESHVNAL